MTGPGGGGRADFLVPLFIRGRTIAGEHPVAYDARGYGTFTAPDVKCYLDLIPLASPGEMADIQALPIAEIVEVLVELGQRLHLDDNRYLQEALEAAMVASEYPESMLRNSYAALPFSFAADALWDLVDSRIGRQYLDGWVERSASDGRKVRVRAFGARALHIPAGNGALIAAITVIRNAIAKGDAIIKAPSNDPLTAVAIARTLADVAPDHPLTKHLTVVYWKGGDREVEDCLYHPNRIEKVVAWGGMAAVRHVAEYIQPGLELIALDPKRSATIVGEAAFIDAAAEKEVARRLAVDVGVANQEACASARVAYVQSGTDPEGLERLNRLGQHVFEQLQALPEHVSTPSRRVSLDLRDSIEASRLAGDWYRVIGADGNEGGVIVSQIPEPVDYAPLLANRVVNLVPIDDPMQALSGITSFTQTVGIYPEALKDELRDVLPLYGAQRMASLGYACSVTPAMPQDAIEPLRRMCKWIVDDHCDPEVVPLVSDIPPVEVLLAQHSGGVCVGESGF